ncbi:creatininase family protein [Patescibacteria group bacterium]|nr:creatininase family protein [Patescibacteria group bacterium]
MKIKKIIILPIGSYEYHGTELPPETDSIISQNLASGLSSALKKHFQSNIILLPAINYGLSLEHSGFPNTMFMAHKTFYDYLSNLLNSINENNSLICIINGHGGNINALQSIEADYNYTHQNSKVFAPPLYPQNIQECCVKSFGEFDTHAGSVEASLISYYANKPKKEYHAKTKKKFSGSLKFFRNIEIYPDGIIKELPLTTADPKKGKLLHEKMTDNLTDSILGLIANIEKIKKDIH